MDNDDDDDDDADDDDDGDGDGDAGNHRLDATRRDALPPTLPASPASRLSTSTLMVFQISATSSVVAFAFLIAPA